MQLRPWLLCHLLATDTWQLFLIRRDTNLGATIGLYDCLSVVTTWRFAVYHLLTTLPNEAIIKFSDTTSYILFYFKRQLWPRIFYKVSQTVNKMSFQIVLICIMNCSISLQSVHSCEIKEIYAYRKLTIFALKASCEFDLYITKLNELHVGDSQSSCSSWHSFLCCCYFLQFRCA